MLRKKFSYIESIPGVLLPHPSSSAFPTKMDGYGAADAWHYQASLAPQAEFYDHHYNQPPLKITPSMSSLEALLSKLPSVVPPPAHTLVHSPHHNHQLVSSSQRPPLEFLVMERVAKEEETDQDQEDQAYRPDQRDVGESSTSMSAAAYQHQQQHHHHFHQHHDQNVASNGTNNGF